MVPLGLFFFRQNIIQCYECTAHTTDKNNVCISLAATTPKIHCDHNSCQAVIRSYKKVCDWSCHLKLKNSFCDYFYLYV